MLSGLGETCNQLLLFCSLVGDSLDYGCYQIYPETVRLLHVCWNCKEEGPNILFSVNSTEIQ